MSSIDPLHLSRIHHRDSLIAFLRDTLQWPAPPDLPADELFYDYSADELRLDAQTGERVRVQQLANFREGQPWGIFLLETANAKLYQSHLRRVLRGLAPTARAHTRSAQLPAWRTQNLLFIATHNYQQFTFAHFTGEQAANAKLSSFGWDQNDVGVRTLCEYNLPALTWPADARDAVAWQKQWAGAFDVEKVTDKFFKEFRDLFEDLKAALPKAIKSAAERHSFTQRLLNRLLFLCFLQKKRWLRGPNDAYPRVTYLFDLFDYAKAQGEDFYADYLHPLFFNALNRPPGADDERTRMRFAQQLGIVPFLNGGLFDPSDHWDARDALALSHKFFEPILGNEGLLRRYNFTVTESTPLNQEVAVDPEMLGKVFETVVLTSEEAADYQAPNLRKATGSYYTPRSVVTFIVRESLQAYLTARVPHLGKERLTRLMNMDASGGIDRAQLRELLTQKEAEAIRAQLQALRACDPAIGSGAFALGLLHELVNLQLLCETVERGRDPRLGQPNLVFDLKKHAIEHNLYGADLQAKAVEICKLRLWLSLIVDYQIVDVDLESCTQRQFEDAIARILPLPNLSYKIRRGDALLDLVHGRAFHLQEALQRNEAMQDAREALESVHRRFFNAQDADTKRQLRLEALTQRTALTRLQLEAQRAQWTTTQGTQLDLLAERKETRAEIRARETALAEIDVVLAEVRELAEALQPLRAKRRLSDADDETLTRLEATSEGEAITFAWELDFPEIFAPSSERPEGFPKPFGSATERGGFDLIVGNPPFVTARNEEKRDAYAERWQETCYKNYQLVAPFFQRAFGLLRADGYLGFIVSNAFAKREFGKPLVEDFFPTVELQKIVDCSGLMFPGHGTPTCIVFGRNPQTSEATSRTSEVSLNAIRIAATLPGGGDLRTAPEWSPLWATLQAHHDQAGYSDERIIVADRPRAEMAKWPWNFDAGNEPTKHLMESIPHVTLSTKVDEPVGHIAITRTDDVFILPEHLARRFQIEKHHLRFLGTGETIRDWSSLEYSLIVFPYDKDFNPLKSKESPNCIAYLKPFRETLENVVMHGSVRKKETDVQWFEYSRLARPKLRTPLSTVLPEIATHNHALVDAGSALFHQTVPVIKLAPSTSIDDHHLLAGLLNSSAALFWLKLVCFNKGAGDEEERDRFVYAGGKVQQLPIPSVLLESSPLRERLTALSRACWERGQQLPRLAYKKLFELEGEAYDAWNSALAGWVPPAQDLTGFENLLGLGWRTADELLALRDAYRAERERLRGEMIALQEEMDWWVYAAYGLISDFRFLISDFNPQSAIENLKLGERPFELLRDGKPSPAHFSAERRALWAARMKVIGENEHIRRIEQPVYKRRWYRKESDAKEFERACAWWLLEKAEWWLEHQAQGGPVTLERWATALWEDERVRAVAESLSTEREQKERRGTEGAATDGSATDGATDKRRGTDGSATDGETDRGTEAMAREFVKWFKSVVVEAAVPAWITPALAWEQVEKKFKRKAPARAKKIRGKLNVPRERFRVTEEGEYVWAGQ